MEAETGCKLDIFFYAFNVSEGWSLIMSNRQLLTKSRVGVRVCIGLLDNMVRLHEAEKGTHAAKAFDIG